PPVEGDDGTRLKLLAQLEDAALDRVTRLLKPITDAQQGVIRLLVERLGKSEEQLQRMMSKFIDAQIARGNAEVAFLEAESRAQTATTPKPPTPLEQLADIAAKKMTDGKVSIPAGTFSSDGPES